MYTLFFSLKSRLLAGETDKLPTVQFQSPRAVVLKLRANTEIT